MGLYFNPGNESFRLAVRSKVYVDKTLLIEKLNDMLFTENRCVSVSHARRFGKSQAAGYLVAINYDKKTKHHTCQIEII